MRAISCYDGDGKLIYAQMRTAAQVPNDSLAQFKARRWRKWKISCVPIARAAN